MKRCCYQALSILLAVLMTLPLVSFAAGTTEMTLLTSQLIFRDAGGRELVQLKSNEQVSAQLTVKNVTDKPVKATLILAYYEYGLLKSLNSYDNSIAGGKDTTMTAAVMTGNNPAKGRLKAFLWESYAGNVVYAREAVFGSADASVENILLDGVSLQGFSPEVREYQVHLPATAIDYPQIHLVTGDLAANVQITEQAFPSEVTIQVTSSDRTAQKSYRIRFTKEAATVSNIVMHYSVGDQDITTAALSTGVAHPEFIKPIPSGVTTGADYYGVGNLKSYTRCVYDRETYLLNIPEYLIGSTLIAGSQSEASNAQKKADVRNPQNRKLMTFDINASADIYYMQVTKGNGSVERYTPWLPEFGFQYVEDLPNWAEATIDAPRLRDGSVYRKTVTVEEGETQTITIGGNEMAFTTPIVFIVWKTAADVVTLKDITLDGQSLDEFTADVTEYDVTLPHTATGMPEIVGVPSVDGARVTVTKDTAANKAVITVTSANGKQTAVYTLQFSIAENPAKIAELKEIQIDGIPFADFDTDVLDYIQALPEGVGTMPNVTAIPTTEDATVRVTTEGKTAVITVTSKDTTVSKTYRITFTVLPAVTNIYMHYGTTGEPNDVDIRTNALKTLQNPVFKTGTPTDSGYYEYGNVESCTKLIYDRDTYLMNLPEYLVGSYLIAGSQSAGKDNVYGPVIKDKDNSNILSFDINTSANIYYLLYASYPSYVNIPWAETAGFQPTDIQLKWVEGANAGAQPKSNLVVYRKTVIVEEGETETVQIGGCNGTFASPCVIIEWNDPASSAELESISVDGQPLENFNKNVAEYTVSLPVGQTTIPAVTATATAQGANVQVIPNGNDVTIRVVSENGNNFREYIIHFKTTVPKVTNVKMHFGATTKAVTAIDTNIQEPVFINTNLTGSDLYRYTNVSSKTHLIGDRETYLIDIPPNLLGQTIISGSQSDASSNAAYVKDGSNNNLMTFEINSSANIYYFLYANSYSYDNIAWAVAAGYTPSDLSIQWVEGKGAEPIAPKTNLRLYQKRIDVPAGETVTVTIGGQQNLFTCPSVIIEWIQ